MNKLRRVLRHPMTYALRWAVPRRYHRAAAKGLFWLSGQMTRVKTWQRSWPMDFNEDGSWRLGRARWGWRTWSLSDRVLSLSMQLDWNHWTHWACVHEHCAAVPCAECGGLSCDAGREEDS